eukprot:jgi/Orpsp1_1/1178587/evm.model.c7180000065950.1
MNMPFQGPFPFHHGHRHSGHHLGFGPGPCDSFKPNKRFSNDHYCHFISPMHHFCGPHVSSPHIGANGPHGFHGFHDHHKHDEHGHKHHSHKHHGHMHHSHMHHGCHNRHDRHDCHEYHKFRPHFKGSCHFVVHRFGFDHHFGYPFGDHHFGFGHHSSHQFGGHPFRHPFHHPHHFRRMMNMSMKNHHHHHHYPKHVPKSPLLQHKHTTYIFPYARSFHFTNIMNNFHFLHEKSWFFMHPMIRRRWVPNYRQHPHLHHHHRLHSFSPFGRRSHSLESKFGHHFMHPMFKHMHPIFKHRCHSIGPKHHNEFRKHWLLIHKRRCHSLSPKRHCGGHHHQTLPFLFNTLPPHGRRCHSLGPERREHHVDCRRHWLLMNKRRSHSLDSIDSPHRQRHFKRHEHSHKRGRSLCSRNNNINYPNFGHHHHHHYWSKFMHHKCCKHKFQPNVHFKEDENNYYIYTNLYGISKDDFKVKCNNNIITISEKSKDKKEKNKMCKHQSSKMKCKKYRMKDQKCCNFKRKIIIPENIKVENIKTNYSNGILEIVINKI